MTLPAPNYDRETELYNRLINERSTTSSRPLLVEFVRLSVARAISRDVRTFLEEGDVGLVHMALVSLRSDGQRYTFSVDNPHPKDWWLDEAREPELNRLYELVSDLEIGPETTYDWLRLIQLVDSLE